MKFYLLPQILDLLKKQTKNTENNIKCEVDIKGNSDYLSISTSNTPYFILQGRGLSPVLSKH